MNNTLNKLYATKKTLVPYFIVILVAELVQFILNFTNGATNIHWTVFGGALITIGLVIALFILNMKQHYKASRVIISILLFFAIVSTIAYTFMSYPKAPNSDVSRFVFYIVYSCILIALYITGLVLHSHLNDERDRKTLKAFQVMGIIFGVVSLINVVYSIVLLGMYGYSSTLMIDLFYFIAYAVIVFFALTIETNCLDIVSKQIDKKNLQKNK